MRLISSTSFFIASTSGVIAEQCQFELEAGQHGAQIVRDAGEHRGALLDRPLDARLHLDEGLRGAAHLARAARPEVRRLAALAEALRGVGEPQDRLDLVAQEADGDRQQHQRRADHPEQENLRVRGVGGAAPGEHAHHRAIELDADLDERGAADGVDPERPADLLAKLDRQRLVEQREERLRSGRRHVGQRQEIDGQPHAILRDLAQPRVVVLLRIDLGDLGQRRDVAHHRGGQMPRHQVPVPLHEHEGDDRLQDHHRRDDDQERAGVEALRQERLVPDVEAAPAVGDTGRRPSADAPCRGRGVVMARPPAGSRCRARSARSAGWSDRARSCAAAG